jgi:ribosomal protein S18 acetylase RimI-like enzyme
MDDKHRIRGATEGDLDRIGEIIRQAWEPIFALHEENWGGELFGVLYANWAENIKANVGRHMAENPDWIFVVESCETGEVMAFIAYLLDRERSMGTVGLNAVAAEFQRQGIGTMMYDFVLSRFREAGLKYAQVRTGLNDAQAAARRAYEKAGFNIARKEVTYYTYL